MSKEKDSGFAGEGFEHYPSIYIDESRIETVTTWPLKLLEDKLREYWQFLNRTDILPAHVERARWLIAQMEFELFQREDHDALKGQDELCEGTL